MWCLSSIILGPVMRLEANANCTSYLMRTGKEGSGPNKNVRYIAREACLSARVSVKITAPFWVFVRSLRRKYCLFRAGCRPVNG